MTTCIECGMPLAPNLSVCEVCGVDAPTIATTENGFIVYDGQPSCECSLCRLHRAVRKAQGVAE